MNLGPTAGSVMTRLSASRLARFCITGGIGFLVDAAVLTWLVNGQGWHPYAARAISFALAVTATWQLNRHWVFERTADIRAEYLRYLSVQVVGAAINLGTYVIVIELAPRLAGIPSIPLAIGAGLALLFNFLASRSFVFESGNGQGHSPAANRPTSGYSGRENLEAMKHAERYNRFLEQLIRRHWKGGRGIDFGAGAGTFAIPLARSGLDVTCLEPDEELRRTLAEAGLPAHAQLESVPAMSADFIYSLNVLEHIEDDAGMLAMLAERLKPGGKLLLYVPAFAVLFSAMDVKVGHFRRYRKAGLRAQVEKAGLRVERAEYVDSLGFFATLLFKCVGDRSGVVSPGSVRLYDRLVFPLSRLADILLHPWLGKNLLVVATRSQRTGVPLPRELRDPGSQA